MRVFAGLLSLLMLCSTALADTLRETVPANRTSTVGTHATYGPSCTSGALPKFKITQPPKNGTVSFKQVSGTLGAKAGRCAGKRIKGTAVVYKPKKGFRGEDKFKVGFKMDMYTAGSAKIRNVVHKYIITVK